MKKKLLFEGCSILFVLFSFTVHAVVWEFHTNGDTEGWSAGPYTTNFTVSGDALTFDTTGGDPQIFSPDNLNVNGSNFRYLHADIEFTASSNQTFQMFFITTADGGWNEAKSIHFTGYTGRQTYLVNIPQVLSSEGKDPNSWLGKTIRQIRLDPGALSGCNVKIYWFGITFGSNSRGAVWDFETNGDFEGWGGFSCAQNQQVTGGYLYFEFNCSDPYVQSPGDLRISGSDYPWLQADIEFSPSDNFFQMFYSTTVEGGYEEARSVVFPSRVGRYTYLINIPQRLSEEGKSGVWNGRTITQIRFDTGGLSSGNVRIYYIGLRREPIPDWQFDVGNHKQGWTAVQQISNLQANGGVLSLNTTGSDPFIYVYNQHFNPSSYRYLLLRANITGYGNNNPAMMQTFGFPGTGAGWYVNKDYYFYPNNGYQCLLVDMGTRTSGNSWLGAPGTINNFRIDPATENTSATFYYDYITLYNSLSWATGPYTWDFSTAGNNNLYGNNCGSWVSAKHSPYGGTLLNIASGVGTVTGTGTLGIENLGFIVGAPSTYRWLQVDVNPATQTDRNDFTLRFAWRNDGLRLGDDYETARKWTIPTNKGIKRYNFLIPYTTGQPSGHTGAWSGVPHGILLQFGEGETGINSVVIDNVSILSDTQVTAPTVTAVEVKGQRVVDITFSQQMDGSTITASSFTISGTGKGTLSTNPFSVQFLTGHTYRLTWIAGEMRDGGDVTITVSASVKDSAGRNLTSPNSATHVGGGIKIDTPTISTVTSPATANTTPITINYTGAADTSSGVNKVELWYKKETGGTWTYSGLSSTSAPNGSFNFTPVSEGTYYFDVVVEDGAGNRSSSPTGNGGTSTIYDITVPTVGSINVPAYTNLNPLP
ncbi:MAG TPA: Ig-like domain-containing protein, partial [Candidatus Hydrogenedens sp.]|nr:Ig-like domain-containing protein [Candidatus Hydrogenedens sp.]HOL20438.1 Ig-like domain-containing protein [Candidatus Hydrogenedens sp.]